MPAQTMTTEDGILNVEFDDDVVLLSLARDDEDTQSIEIPTFNFAWIAELFRMRTA